MDGNKHTGNDASREFILTGADSKGNDASRNMNNNALTKDGQTTNHTVGARGTPQKALSKNKSMLSPDAS